jgi:hypothetical protein
MYTNYEFRHDSVFSVILLDRFSLSTRLSVCVYPLCLEPGTHIHGKRQNGGYVYFNLETRIQETGR